MKTSLRGLYRPQDIDGIDQGLLYSQQAEFSLLLKTVQRTFNIMIGKADTDEEDYQHLVSRAEIVTRWPLMAYLLSCLSCLGLSTSCHWLYCKNEHVCKVVTYLDFWGIALLFLGASYTYISFKYACGPFIVWRYTFTSVIALLTLVCCWASVQPSIMSPLKRSILFFAFGLSCLVPVVLLYFWHDPRYTLNPKFEAYAWPMICLFVGVLIYILRVPEKWSKTGTFDFIG